MIIMEVDLDISLEMSSNISRDRIISLMMEPKGSMRMIERVKRIRGNEMRRTR
jgi:hypothetical protein